MSASNMKNKSWCKSGGLRFRHHRQTLRLLPVEAKSIGSHLERLLRRRGLDRNQASIYSCECYTHLMPQQNPHLVKMTARSALRTTTSRHGIPAKGEKVTYTSAVRGAREKWPVNARQRPRTAQENSAGICTVKGLRGARWGTDRLFVSRGITY